MDMRFVRATQDICNAAFTASAGTVHEVGEDLAFALVRAGRAVICDAYGKETGGDAPAVVRSAESPAAVGAARRTSGAVTASQHGPTKSGKEA